jgi:hypothetical protein
MEDPLHICRLQSMVLLPRMVVIPPHTALPIVIDTSGVWISILLGVIQDFCHETPRVIENGLNLQTVSCILGIGYKKYSHHHEHP